MHMYIGRCLCAVTVCVASLAVALCAHGRASCIGASYR